MARRKAQRGVCVGACRGSHARARIRKRGARGLSKVEWSGPTSRAKVVVGLNPGAQDRWTGKARCKSAPKVRDVDSAFLRLRKRQIDDPGATRYRALGVYKGADEKALVYDVIDDGSDGGKRKFRRNMAEIAENLSRRFCQDEVLVEYVDAQGNARTCSYSHGSGGSGYCKPKIKK